LLRIRLPMLTRAILTAAAVGFSVSVGQYLPTVLIGAGRLTTVTTEAVALAAGGNRRVIGVYAFMQTLLPFLAFAIATGLPGLLFRNRRGLRV
jgi:putative thiamine transport system permease protein